MAFYIVTDGKTNAYGEADTFLVRARGKRQAVEYAPVVDAKGATVEKLEDGREYPAMTLLASFAENTDDMIAPEPSGEGHGIYA